MDIQVRRDDGPYGLAVRMMRKSGAAYADDASAALAELADDRPQVGEVADAPVLLGAHGVELHGGPPAAPAVGERGRLVAARRRHREERLAERRATVPQRELVVAARQRRRQRQHLAVRVVRQIARHEPGLASDAALAP
jgi:hypothetical protein